MKCFSLLLILHWLSECSAAVTTTSVFQVQIPQTLRKGSDGYEHRDALFGIPPYGGSIQQQIIYADSDLCNQNVDKQGGFPEREKDDDGKMAPWKSPYILMVDRGTCTFVQKVRNAQRAGATAVLIADYSCRCSDDVCMNLTNASTCEATEPFMADDGSGSDVSIPSFLLFKHDADRIKEVLRQNQPVHAEMRFSVPAPDNHVEYDLWSTPRNPVAQEFITDFQKAAEAFGTSAQFTPHMYVMDGERSGCRGMDGEDVCLNLCTNSGRYCSADPDDDLYSGASGADVVKESLRSICIWKIYGGDGVGIPWWTYVNQFRIECDPDILDDSEYNDEDCIETAMAVAGVDVAKVEKCMADSGGLEDDVENTMFEKELSDKEVNGVFIIPSLFVNQAPLRGELGFATAFKAICAGFVSGTEPDICLSCATCNDPELCVERGYCTIDDLNGGRGVSAVVFLMSLLGLSVAFGIVGYVVYRRQQELMKHQIRGIVQQYMPVGANKNGEGEIVDTSLGLDEGDDDDDLKFTIS